jgi:hypothetical protein
VHGLRLTHGGIALEVTEILRTKLQGIDTECETAARPDIDKLYGQARYDGSRFIVPSFQEAGAVWLKLISEKERRFVSEIERVCAVSNAILDATARGKVEEIIDELFDDDRYIDRLKNFSEGIVRIASRYGLALNLSERRFDIVNTAYRAGVMNTARRARKNMRAEIALHSRSAIPESVNKFAKWRSYIKDRPWAALAALALLMLAWIASKVDLSGIFTSSGGP